jgi:hypothetical protein
VEDGIMWKKTNSRHLVLALNLALASACALESRDMVDEPVDVDSDTERFKLGDLGGPRSCSVHDGTGKTIIDGGEYGDAGMCCGMMECGAADPDGKDEDCEEGEIVEACLDCDAFKCTVESESPTWGTTMPAPIPAQP